MSSEPMGSTMATTRDQGMELMRAGKFADAAAVLKEATMEDGNDELAWRLLGGARANSGDTIGAAQAFQRAVALAPTSAKNHYNLALALQANDQSYEAKRHLEQAIALEPGYDQARVRLDAMMRAAQSGESTAAPTAKRNMDAGDGLAPMGQAKPSEQQTTNIGAGSGDMGGLAPVGSSYTPPTATTTNIGLGSGDMGGLAPVGHSFAAQSASSGTTNINASSGDTGGLASLGGGALPQGARPAAPGAPPVVPPPSPYVSPYPATPGSAGAGAYTPGGARLAPPQPVLGGMYGAGQNTSGMKGDVPQEIAGTWNWGAFYFNWIWLLNHGLIGAGLGVLAFFAAIEAGAYFLHIPFVGIISLGVRIYLGRNGNRLGWQNRRFESVDDFRKCQRIWAWWVLGFVLTSIVVIFLSFGVILAMFAAAATQKH